MHFVLLKNNACFPTAQPVLAPNSETVIIFSYNEKFIQYYSITLLQFVLLAYPEPQTEGGIDPERVRGINSSRTESYLLPEKKYSRATGYQSVGWAMCRASALHAASSTGRHYYYPRIAITIFVQIKCWLFWLVIPWHVFSVLLFLF
jgi:hypothetical protein